MAYRALNGAVLAVAVVLSATAAQAADRVMSFAVRGVVTEVMAKAGQSVKAGQILARLDGRIFAANVASAKAALTAAELEQTFAADAEKRAVQLFEDLSASAEEVERGQLRHAKAKAGVAAANAKLVKARWKEAQAILRAPSAGTVVKVPGFKGQAVMPRAGVQPVVVLSGK